jgi:hypothetical protein
MFDAPVPAIRAVFDRTALRSYTNGHVHVGDIVRMFASDDELVAVPATTLLQAHAESLDDKEATGLLALLTKLPGIAVVNLDAAAAANAAESVAAVNGDLALGQAIWIALEHEAVYFSVEPGDAAAVLTEDQIIPIPAEDA